MRAPSMSALSHRPSATCFSLQFDPLRTPFPFLCSAKFSVPARNLRNVSLSLPAQPLKLSRGSSIVSCAASQEEQKHSEVEVEKVKNELDLQADESPEAWKQTLESFREQALKMQSMSQEAYDAYSKKAGLILMKTSHQLKIQAENARHDLGVVAKEITEEGKEYISTIAEKSPEPVKEIVETFSSSTNELNHLSEVRDFYLGIPYGVFLSVGGFLSFMLTGSISAIRFGIILGGTLLALSILSLRSWKGGESSTLNLKSQGAIALVIFIRELRFLSQRASLPTSLMTLISGTMVIFYAYRIWLDGQKFGSGFEQQSED